MTIEVEEYPYFIRNEFCNKINSITIMESDIIKALATQIDT